MNRYARIIAFMIVLLIIIGGFLGIRYMNSESNRATGNPTTTPTVEQAKEKNLTDGGTLIIYFSLPGKTLIAKDQPPANLKLGTTAQVANLIHAKVGGDLIEIKPAEPYSADPETIKVRAKKEQAERIYPAIAGKMPDVSKYSRIFIGYPIWLGEQPMVVQTFLRDAHINNQHVYPFLTSIKTGWGRSGDAFTKFAPNAKLGPHFEVKSLDVVKDPAGTKAAVNSWLESLVIQK